MAGGRVLPHPQAARLRPTRHRRVRDLTRTQNAALLRLAHRGKRGEPINRCRMVHTTLRRGKEGVRDLVMAICGALQDVRVRLSP
jgi:hypothetical protein